MAKSGFCGLAAALLTMFAADGSGQAAQPKNSAGNLNTAPETERLAKNWQSLKDRQLRLLPVPKELDFTGEEIGVDKIVVVIKKDNEAGQIAANEIASRVSELTGRDIQISTAPVNGSYNIIIDNVYPNKFTGDGATEKLPGENQAYGLYPEKESFVLAGRGDLGVMYAAVTARWLIGEKNGKIIFYPAKVTDWPDYKYRQMSMSYRFPYMEKYRDTPELHLKEFKKYIDYLFRIKTNRIGPHTWSPFQGAYSPFKTEPEASGEIIQSIRKVNDYARLRGIESQIIIDESLGLSPYQKSPELEKMYLMPWHNIYVSWARHDLHAIKANKIAKFCKAAGISIVHMHSPDSGGIRDPEMWSERDALSKKIYPVEDDRARADADVFNIYAETLGKEGIEVIFIQYPYSAGYLNEDDVIGNLGLPDRESSREAAKKLVAKTEEWIRKVNSLIPLKNMFEVRESPSKDIIRYCNTFKNRPFCVYFEVHNPGNDISELLPRELNTLRSSYIETMPGIKSIMLSTYGGFNEPTAACASEYSWNTGFPGWSDLDRSRLPYVYNPTELEIMAERAAVGLWGAEAGRDLKEVFDRLLSIDLAIKPEAVLERLTLKNLPEIYSANHGALLRAEKALDRAWSARQRALAEKRPCMDNFSYPFFVQYYMMIKGTLPYSIVNLALMQAQEELKSGNLEKSGVILQEAQGSLDKSELEFKRISQLLEKEPMVYPYGESKPGYYRELPKIMALNPNFAALKGQLDDLLRNREKIYQQGNIPPWFGDFLKKRPIYAAFTDKAIKIDGEISEPEWTSAVPVEYFVNSQIFKLPSAPVFARILHDGKKLYVSGEINQPLVSEIKDKKHGSNEWVLAESFELFLVPDSDNPGNMFQIVVDLTGNVFTLKKVKTSITEPPRDIAGWDAGLESAVKKTPNGWGFEFSVLFEKIGINPGAKWKCMLAYNRVEKTDPEKIEGYASSFVEGQGFHRTEYYSNLVFAKTPPHTQYDINIKCEELDMKSQLHASGTGSLVIFRPEIETRRPLKNVSVEARFLIKNKEQAGRMKLKDVSYLPLFWKNPAPFQFQMEEVHKGVVLEIKVDYQTLEGKKDSVSKNFILGDWQAVLADDEIFHPGRGDQIKALAAPVYFDVVTKDGEKLLNLAKGSISFRFRKMKDFNENTRHCLFHFGPIRRGDPLSYNRSSILAILENDVLSFMITSDQYQLRRVSAMLPKIKDSEWLDLDFKWDLNADGKTRMEISFNGKKLSDDRITAWKAADGAAFMAIKDEGNLVMQVGCLNSGSLASDGTFENLLISGKDGQKLSFSFNNTLAGKYELNNNNGELKACLGSLWR